MYLRDGFPGQRLRVLPRPLVYAAPNQPVLGRLLVTDAGYFPRASAHGRSRPQGAPEAVVILCVSGAGVVDLGDTTVRVDKGSAVVLPPGVRHRYRAEARDPWTIWWAHVMGADVPEFMTAILGDPANPLIPVRNIFRSALALEDTVQALETDETDASLLRASAAMWSLLASFASDRLRGPAGNADRIGLVQDYLRANLQTKDTVTGLARMANLSTSHFSALFKSTTGVSVMEYLQRLRSARARELLTTTDAPIGEIAASVGYEDPLYFSRLFRRLNGMSASEFRRAQRGADVDPVDDEPEHRRWS